MKFQYTSLSQAPCAEWSRQLAAVHTDDLSASERAALDTHIATCAACTAARAAYRAMDAAILALPPVAPLTQLSTALYDVVGVQRAEEQDRDHTLLYTSVAPDEPVTAVAPVSIIKKRPVGRRMRMMRVMSTIAAVLVIGLLLAGFAGLFFSHHVTTVGGPAPTDAGAVVYGVVVTSYNDGAVYAIRPSDGAFYWHTSLGVKLTGAERVSHGIVYVGSYDGAVYALKASNGVQLWRHVIRTSIIPSPTSEADSPGSIVADDKAVYISAGSGVYALRASDGSQLWHLNPPVVCDANRDSNTCVRVVVTLANGTVFAFFNGLYAIRASDGHVLWHNDTLQFNSPAVFVANGKFYTPGYDGYIHAVRVSDGRIVHFIPVIKDQPVEIALGGQTLYINDGGQELVAVRTSDDSVLWRKPFAGLVANEPIVSGDTIYLAMSGTTVASIGIAMPGMTPTMNTTSTGSTDLYALRTSDGGQRWRWHRSVEDSISSPVVVNDLVLFSYDSGLYALRTSDGKQVWQRSLAEPLELITA